ncbi:MAG: flippase [Patescibacteria group bacterium]
MIERVKSFLFTNNSIRQTLVKNTFWLSVSEVGSRLLKFALILYAARILGVSDWGVFSYALGMASLFLVISDLGLNNLITREMAKKSEARFQYLSTAFFIRIALLIIAIVIILAIVPQISDITTVGILFIVALGAAIDSVRDFLVSLHRAMERMEKETFIKISASLLTSILGIMVLLRAPSIINLAYAYLAGSIIGLLIALYTLRREISDLTTHLSVDLVLPILKITWPLFIFGIIGVIMTYTDIAMIGWWKNSLDVGLYSVAQRLIQFLLVIPNLIAIAMFPVFSKLLTENPAELRPTLEKTLAWMFLLGLPLFAGGIVLGKEIIVVIFGAAYAPGGPVFQILLLTILLMFPMLIINNYIFVLNQHKKFVSLMVGGALFNILLNFILVKKFGILGAATGTTLSNLVLGILMWQKARKISYFEILSHIKKIILATLVMGGFSFVFKTADLHVILNILFSGAVFFYVLVLLKEPLLRDTRPAFLKNRE